MIKKDEILDTMREYYPLGNTKLKWEFDWYNANNYYTVKKLISERIHPKVIADLKFDKDVQLTMKMLETETAMFYIQFVENLDVNQIKEILNEMDASWINYYYDN